MVSSHGLEDLERDMRGIARKAPGDMARVVRNSARAGTSEARAYARATSGAHAKNYPGSITSEMTGVRVGDSYSAEFGPEAVGQGNLAPILEDGSNNNPPHNNLARAADFVGPFMAREVRRLIDGWFW